MKHFNNTKNFGILTFFVLGILFFTTSCTENNAADSKNVAEQENMAKATDQDDNTIVVVKNDDDARFLMDAAELQLEEISLGNLAQQKGTNIHVKELGKMMVTDHTLTLNELKILAQSKSVSIPASITEDSKSAYDKLDNKSGNEFNKDYSDLMVKHHKNAIELFEKASTKSEDAEIRAWATQKLPGLKTHLKHAEDCKMECDKLKS